MVSAVASTEKEAIKVGFVKERIRPLFDAIDESKDGLISKSEFLSILENAEAVQLLEEVGVDVIFLLDQSDTIFQDDLHSGSSAPEKEKTLTFEALMEIVLELRGSNYATVKHIVELRRHTLAAIHHTNLTLLQIQGTLTGSIPTQTCNTGPRPPRRSESFGAPFFESSTRLRAREHDHDSSTRLRALSDTSAPPAPANDALRMCSPLERAFKKYTLPSDVKVSPLCEDRSLIAGLGDSLVQPRSKAFAGPEWLLPLRKASQCPPMPPGRVPVQEGHTQPLPSNAGGFNGLLERLRSITCEALCHAQEEIIAGFSDTAKEAQQPAQEDLEYAERTSSAWPLIPGSLFPDTLSEAPENASCAPPHNNEVAVSSVGCSEARRAIPICIADELRHSASLNSLR